MEYRTTETNDILEQPKELPGMLNTLTVLTFIGCAISYLSSLWSFYSATNYQQNLEKMQEAQDKLGDSTMGKMIEGSMEMLKKSHDYRYIILIVGLVFTTLCLVGALQMRKLKKGGFAIYTIGELVPLIITPILMGVNLSAGIGLAVGAVIAIFFVALYAS
ncbi:MAG: hypothetical protein C4329_06385, partial [Chitinophagaceae bacterium]